MGRGRKCNVDRELVIESILKYKECVVIKNVVVSKNDPIWEIISKDLNNKIKPLSLHALACSRKENVRPLLVSGETNFINPDENISENIPLSICATDFIEKDNGIQFKLSLTQREFEGLITTKVIKNRTCVRFKSGSEWTDILAHKIWTQTPLTCSFSFKTHYLTNDAASGKMDGKYTETNMVPPWEYY